MATFLGVFVVNGFLAYRFEHSGIAAVEQPTLTLNSFVNNLALAMMRPQMLASKQGVFALSQQTPADFPHHLAPVSKLADSCDNVSNASASSGRCAWQGCKRRSAYFCTGCSVLDGDTVRLVPFCCGDCYAQHYYQKRIQDNQ